MILYLDFISNMLKKIREKIWWWITKLGDFVKSFAPWTATLGVLARWTGSLLTTLWLPSPWLIWSGKLTTLIGGSALAIGEILNRSWKKIS